MVCPILPTVSPKMVAGIPSNRANRIQQFRHRGGTKATLPQRSMSYGYRHNTGESIRPVSMRCWIIQTNAFYCRVCIACLITVRRRKGVSKILYRRSWLVHYYVVTRSCIRTIRIKLIYVCVKKTLFFLWFEILWTNDPRGSACESMLRDHTGFFCNQTLCVCPLRTCCGPETEENVWKLGSDSLSPSSLLT